MMQVGTGYTADNVYALVLFDVAPSGQPACATDSQKRFAINPATDAGKAMMSVLLTVKANGAVVEIVVTNDCSTMNGWESISYLRLK